MNHPLPMRLNKETEEEKTYYNKKAAHERHAIIDHQVKMFLERGGKITKLPSYDDNLGARGKTIYSEDDYEDL